MSEPMQRFIHNWQEGMLPCASGPYVLHADAAAREAALLARLAEYERLGPDWTCVDCGAMVSQGGKFKTIQNYSGPEPSDFDCQCEACGSVHTVETPEDALREVVDNCDALLARAEAAEAALATEREDHARTAEAISNPLRNRMLRAVDWTDPNRPVNTCWLLWQYADGPIRIESEGWRPVWTPETRSAFAAVKGY